MLNYPLSLWIISSPLHITFEIMSIGFRRLLHIVQAEHVGIVLIIGMSWALFLVEIGVLGFLEAFLDGIFLNIAQIAKLTFANSLVV